MLNLAILEDNNSYRIHSDPDNYINGKYQDRTAAILAGLGSELEADVEMSGCSLESESELGQWEAKPKPTTQEFCTKSDASGEDGTDGLDREDLLK